jgi:uncharacterized protein YktA (UPF0223 family)
MILNFRILIFILITFKTIQVSGQQIGYREITEKRMEYIAQKLPLTVEEAQKFWPLFREFHDQREKISKNSKQKNKQSDNKKPVSEEDFLNAINFMIESKTDQANLMKDYNKRYLEILPAEKVYRLYQIDEDFNKFLLNQLKGPGENRRK